MILSFRLGTYEGVIDETNHSITVKVPYRKDIRNLEETIWAPAIEWVFTISYSSLVSFPGLFKMVSGILIFPMS